MLYKLMLNLLFFLCYITSSVSFADSVTLECPKPSQLVRAGKQWSATIPATQTQDGRPISAITLVGELQGEDRSNMVFKVTGVGTSSYKTETEVGPMSFYCDYETEDSQSAVYLRGNISEISNFDCKSIENPYGVVCSSKSP